MEGHQLQLEKHILMFALYGMFVSGIVLPSGGW